MFSVGARGQRFLGAVIILIGPSIVAADPVTVEVGSIWVPDQTAQVISLPADTGVVSEKTLTIENLTLGDSATLQIPQGFKSLWIKNFIAQKKSKIELIQIGDGANGASPSKDGGGAAGAAGQKTRVFFDKIDGDLLIEARGGDGAAGRDGRDGRQGTPGKKGRDGRTLFFGIFISDGDDGTPGGVGESGGTGEPGGAGGAGGLVSLYYKEKTPSASILIDVAGGRAGMGGHGGAGGIGGNGGPGGRGVHHGHQGPLGPSGSAGNAGTAGAHGDPGMASVYQVGSDLFECLFFLDWKSRSQLPSDSEYNDCIATGEAEHDPENSSQPVQVASPLVGMDSHIKPDRLDIRADGAAGYDSSESLAYGGTPSAGSSGGKGGSITLVIRQLPPIVNLSARGGQGGRGGRGGKGRSGTRDEPSGGDGGRGSNGGRGGGGGRVRLVFLPGAIAHLQLNIDVWGGDGGEGGLGGNPGSPGVANAPAGNFGKKGNPGNPGSPGGFESYNVKSFADWIVREFKEQSKTYFAPHT